MKKSFFAMLFFVFLLLLSASVKSDISNPLESPIQKVSDSVENTQENAQEVKSLYLQREWTKILEKNNFGRFLLSIHSVIKAFNPVIKALIGIDYTLSWIFFITFIIWIGLVILVYRAFQLVFQNNLINFMLGILITTLGAHSGVISKSLSFFTPLFKNDWIIIISIVIAIILIFIFNAILKAVNINLKKIKKREIEARREDKARLTEKINDIKIKSS